MHEMIYLLHTRRQTDGTGLLTGVCGTVAITHTTLAHLFLVVLCYFLPILICRTFSLLWGTLEAVSLCGVLCFYTAFVVAYAYNFQL